MWQTMVAMCCCVRYATKQHNRSRMSRICLITYQHHGSPHQRYQSQQLPRASADDDELSDDNKHHKHSDDNNKKHDEGNEWMAAIRCFTKLQSLSLVLWISDMDAGGAVLLFGGGGPPVVNHNKATQQITAIINHECNTRLLPLVPYLTELQIRGVDPDLGAVITIDTLSAFKRLKKLSFGYASEWHFHDIHWTAGGGTNGGGGLNRHPVLPHLTSVSFRLSNVLWQPFIASLHLATMPRAIITSAFEKSVTMLLDMISPPLPLATEEKKKTTMIHPRFHIV